MAVTIFNFAHINLAKDPLNRGITIVETQEIDVVRAVGQQIAHTNAVDLDQVANRARCN